MNIYQVTRTTPTDYDTYSSFICYAENEEQAKKLNPGFPSVFHPEFEERRKNSKNYHVKFYIGGKVYFDRCTWVQNTNEVTVTKIGVSDFSKAGVILASYHAG